MKNNPSLTLALCANEMSVAEESQPSSDLVDKVSGSMASKLGVDLGEASFNPGCTKVTEDLLPGDQHSEEMLKRIFGRSRIGTSALPLSRQACVRSIVLVPDRPRKSYPVPSTNAALETIQSYWLCGDIQSHSSSVPGLQFKETITKLSPLSTSLHIFNPMQE